MRITRKDECRSHCPINFGLEAIGDKWSLLILRDIVLAGKRTYGEFLKSEEGIATNLLASRLVTLEELGILKKSPDPNDKRKDIYSLTEKGLDLIPMMLELAAWAAKYDPKSDARKHPAFASRVVKDTKRAAEEIKELVRKGGFVFSGDMEVPAPTSRSRK